MQTNTILKSLLLSLMILTSLDARENISLYETQALLKKQTVHIIEVSEKTKWKGFNAQVKNYQSINRNVLEYKHPKIDFSKYDKHTPFIVSSKNELLSKKFVKKLRENGFSHVKYLTDGTKAATELLRQFRGLKLFSIFNQ